MITPEREITYLDKSTWGDGPWQSEPDKIQWTDEVTGLPCLAVRNSWSGNWCGYVGVAEGHPAFGLSYDEADKLAPADEYDYSSFRVHGGLTYSAFCQTGKNAEDRGICHVPQPGQPDRIWWLGFDCAHCDDLSPAVLLRYDKSYCVYRTLEYVQSECADLAAQLKSIATAQE